MIRSKGMKNLSATSISRIRRMIAAVLAEPEYFDQDSYGRNTSPEKGEPACGTVCFGAGWAVWLYNEALYLKMMKTELSFSWREQPWREEATQGA